MSELDIPFSFNGVDWAMLAVLAVSLLVGIWRGFVFELLSLFGWLVAFIVAQASGPALALHLPIGEEGSAARVGAAFALAFFGTLILWSILARLARLLVHATPLTVIDRLLGAAFGLLRGGVLLMMAALFIRWTPAAHSAAWTESICADWLDQALHAVAPFIPAALTRWLSA